MIDIVGEKCTGCSACENLCPVKAIKMEYNSTGFKYPVINMQICTECNYCEKSCPVINNTRPKTKVGKISYVVKNKDDIIRKESSSGGFFSALATYFMQNGGVVYGVAFNNEFDVEYVRISKIEELYKIRGSKYVQCNAETVLKDVENDLKKDIDVLFSGTPCQIAGLISFLRQEYKNLYVIDVVCHGVPSPIYYEKYKDYLQKTYKSKISKINFRNKTYGYHSGTIKIDFENGKTYSESGRSDPYLKAFFGGVSLRESCFNCQFKDNSKESDFTIFDCWHPDAISNFIKRDDDKGYTNVIINSTKGLEIFKKITDYCDYEISDTNKTIILDGDMLHHSAVKSDLHDKFLSQVSIETFEDICKSFTHVSVIDKSREILKKVLYKIGIMSKITKNRRKSSVK